MHVPFRGLIRPHKVRSRGRPSSYPPAILSCTFISAYRRAWGPRTFSAMAPKRKSTNMALMTQNIAHIDSPVPDHSSLAPRRSGRIVEKKGQGLRPGAEDVDREDRSKVKKEKKEGNAGVESVMSSLREMEDNLRNAVKRQKLAVDQSAILASSRGSDDEEAAFFPIPTGNMPELTPAWMKKTVKRRRSSASDEIKPTIEKESRESAGELPEEHPSSIKREGSRPPPVNSDYLPLPWKGRLGYACLNTYLRKASPPVFSSRTCRLASIIDHRHPLRDPSQPEHSTKNRPDKDKPPDVARGQKFVESLGLANARDIVKMIRWNDKYGIKFMRLSSEMFPFASHEEYGYKLAPFAAEVLAEAGRVAGELGHRLTTHPGQFTQLGSPRTEVVSNSVRDLEYHDELLTLLRLPEQQNKDAVMILHMGGVFGDKRATLDRFRKNYAQLSDSIKARLVLENDDVSWTVHDLLPICEELNIPLVLDFHHHNIMFDTKELREGTQDIMELFPRIKATWTRKGITQKMHYSEPCSGAVTPRQRRKHRPRVMTLPPCPNDIDLMIEAKDKEQAVFDLMRNFKLPGWNTFNDVIPYEREDDNRPPPPTPKKKGSKRMSSKKKGGDEHSDDEEVEEAEKPQPPVTKVPDAELGMGGPNNRVYWPVGMEEWLRPRKREVKRKKKGGASSSED
ncbi:UV-endonuclease UvdE-domain-containing protein [Biscogniauxia sp. FL1348]|nr:UV-endonuclease UvdE-domain-containing protein [Biscogniauxia sp. FL1348]